MGKIVNQTELGEILGVTRDTLWRWQKAGMPCSIETENGLANQYDTESVIAWWGAKQVRRVQSESAKNRLARLQGDRVQMDLDEKAARLIPVEEIEPAWRAMVQSARTLAAPEPDRLARLIENTDGMDTRRDLIADAFDAFLGELSTYDIGDEDQRNTSAAGIPT